MSNDKTKEFEYDIGLSFAGEQRKYVEEVAAALVAKGIRVFFDDYEGADLWGKDLYAHLNEVYQFRCRYCILFASQEYGEKIWTNHERRNAQARALEEKGEYLLPARFDDTPIPGLPNTIHYINLNETSPNELADLASTKLGKDVRKNFLPPVLDRLYERLGLETQDDDIKSEIYFIAQRFFNVLRRMNTEERDAILSLIYHGCEVELPENIHINVDLLRRVTGKSVPRLKRLLGDIRSLGFECVIRKSCEEDSCFEGELLGESYLFEITWSTLSDPSEFLAIEVAREMVLGATENYCEEHGLRFLERLDFSQLAAATATEE